MTNDVGMKCQVICNSLNKKDFASKTRDRIKEEIGLHKLLMTITSVIASSLTGWLFNNAKQISVLTLTLVFVGMFVSAMATIFFTRV